MIASRSKLAWGKVIATILGLSSRSVVQRVEGGREDAMLISAEVMIKEGARGLSLDGRRRSLKAVREGRRLTRERSTARESGFIR
jgi:hypothetical protein